MKWSRLIKKVGFQMVGTKMAAILSGFRMVKKEKWPLQPRPFNIENNYFLIYKTIQANLPFEKGQGGPFEIRTRLVFGSPLYWVVFGIWMVGIQAPTSSALSPTCLVYLGGFGGMGQLRLGKRQPYCSKLKHNDN